MSEQAFRAVKGGEIRISAIHKSNNAIPNLEVNDYTTSEDDFDARLISDAVRLELEVQ